MKDPSFEISGLTMGDKVHNILGNAIVKDHINMIEAEIVYNPPQEVPSGLFGSISNKIFGAKQTTDTISVQIFQMRHG